MAKTGKLGFEQALERLEAIVEEMQSSDLPLEARLKRFEEGVTLVRECAKQLEGATKRVEVLVKASGGKGETRLFEEVRARLRETVGGDYAVDGEEASEAGANGGRPTAPGPAAGAAPSAEESA